MRALLAIDLSDHPEPLIAAAVGWAIRLGARLDLLWVDSLPLAGLFTHEPTVAAIIAREQERLRARSADQVGALIATMPEEVRGEGHVRAGPPGPTVIEAADAYDLVIVGTHGRTGVARFWLGSVAEHVVRGSPRPVLTLHADGVP